MGRILKIHHFFAFSLYYIGTLLPAEDEKPKGFVGYNAETFTENLWSDYHDHKPENRDSKLNQGNEIQNFFVLFGVFFPAVTGIVAGANLSGDLKDPATGKHFCTCVTYV